jgi:two-component system, OmpR family, heavy metal sensor histidine kinase CusS
MSSGPTETESIASRLVLQFTLASAILVGCSLGIFYWLVTRHTFEEDNAALTDKVAALVSETKTAGPDKALQAEVHNIRAGEQSPYWVRIIDPTGRILAERPGMTARLPTSIFPQSSHWEATKHPINHRSGGDLFSLVSAAVRANDVPYLLQIAQDRTADENFNHQAGLLFLTTLAASIVASAIIARTTTRRGLEPLDQMSRAFRRIGPTRLSERVREEGWPRELRPLALSFDQMLGRLEDSFTRLSRFSADLAHELRTPLSNMQGEVQVALTRERPAEEYRSVIESTAVECERLSRIVDNLLFLARAESAREQIKRTSFDGRATIEKIAAFYQTIAEDRDVIVSCNGQAKVDGDSFLFTRAVSNLVDNALRFTPAGGTITISVENENGDAKVSVTDSGAGIPLEHIPHVFDRFYAVDPARNSGGSGLGLALVKSITELHGGLATIRSEVNRGTTVTLTFPAQSDARNDITPEQSRRTQPLGNGV